MNQTKVNGEEMVFGLDIGTRNVVGTVGYRQGERFVVVAQEIRQHQTRAMLDGQIHDINRVAATIADIRQALQEKTGLELNDVCIAAAGRVLKTLNVHVDMELDTERNVTKDDMSALVSMGVEKAYADFQEENDSDTQFYCVGYSIMKHYLNGMWMEHPEHHKAKNIGADMIATFLPDDVIDGLYSAVELAGLEVANLTLEPIAAIRVAIPEKFRLLNIAMIDVGAGTSDISITDDGSVIAFGMLAQAGDALTEILARTCLIDFATAEKVKTAASQHDKIIYEDIMGLEQTITADEVLEICRPEIEKMAKSTAEAIKELNGGVSPSAVFIVGGGGKMKGFDAKIAEELGLDPKRVALRGETIMQDIDFPEGALKDSTIITPIGICLNYYEQTNNIIYVNFNGRKIKLYDNNKLTVMDAAVQASFAREGLFPKRGEEISYTVNGESRVARGAYGESAHIYVNNEEVDLSSGIKANDEIVIEESTIGKPANEKISELPDYDGMITLNVNGKDMQFPKPVKVNGNMVSEDYLIQEGDCVEIGDSYTYEDLLAVMEINAEEMVLFVNGEKAEADVIVKKNDRIEIKSKEAALQEIYDAQKESEQKEAETKEANTETEPVKAEEAASEETKEDAKAEDAPDEEKHEAAEDSNKIIVIVNQKPIVMQGKEQFTFVDIFDYIDFDTSKMRGAGIATLVNGKDAQYTQELHNGDKIEVYWK